MLLLQKGWRSVAPACRAGHATNHARLRPRLPKGGASSTLQAMGDTPTTELLALQEALVGRYSLQREIGRGGMGIVYLAQDVSLDRPVALKLLPPALAVQPSLRERFLREARTAARLSHPNIVPIHAVEEVGAFVFYVMAYVDGETLEKRVRARGPLPPSEAARVLREVAWALGYAHAHGAIHRDVKAANVLLDRETGRAMVMDFGIAQVRAGPGLTAVGEVLGTAEYMSPEQASGEPVDERSDVYSMGVLGHYVFAGRLPFQGSTVAATLAKHLTQAPPALAKAAPHVPAGLAKVVDRCLEKNPDARFVDGDKLAEGLSRAMEERRVIPVPLRSYIEQSLDRRGSILGFMLFAAYFVLLATTTATMEAPAFLPATLLAVAIAMGLTPVTLLVRMTRALFRAGYGREDLVAAAEAYLRERREEEAFEIGATKTWVDHVGPRMVKWGLATSAAGTLATVFLDMRRLPPAVVFGLAGLLWVGFLTTFLGMPLAAVTIGRGRRIPGARWLQFWKSTMGKWVFDVAGLRLEASTMAPAQRPTEVLIGTAADRLFETLSKTMQRELRGLPETVRMLEADAKQMRAHADRLERLLAGIDETPRPAGSEERARLRGDLEKAREQARERMGQVVSALETIRLGLLRLHAGEGSVERLTAELGSAKEVSEQIHRLIEGQEEVRRLLGVDPDGAPVTDDPHRHG